VQTQLTYPPVVKNFVCGRNFPPANELHSENGQNYVLIDHLESMDPFFLSIVGAGNHWLFCHSHGALSAGRHSPETALFPYYTVDKILDNWNTTGPWTAIESDGQLWEPFNPSIKMNFSPRRRLMKSEVGDEVVFEETHEELELRYTYRWQLSERFGFVRRVRIENLGAKERKLRVVDGLDNLLPAGVDQRTQTEYSCLTDAYKASELLCEGRLLVHRLASGITDEAVPMESLRATTVWTTGFNGAKSYLTRQDAAEFIQGGSPEAVSVLRARRGAIFRAGEMSLAAGESQEWLMVAEMNQTQGDVGRLSAQLKNPEQLEKEVSEDVLQGRERFLSLVAAADGAQVSADRDVSLHHYQNTLSNILRGGVPAEGYVFKRNQFISYLEKNNKPVTQRHEEWLSALPSQFTRGELLEKISEQGDADLLRLAEEYLPLMLSRRHGDPSRPWNKFAIDLKDENGDPVLNFQGNWRDIFQNWEALALSYPEYLGSFISKFLNASTVDGFNPYRITSEGCDWEVPDEDDPWASIGYWGDHQIIYLLKLLELQSKVKPEALSARLNDPSYVFADVPYLIGDWEKTLEDPRETITFDQDRHDRLMVEKERYAMAEKLLLPAVVKIANLVPDGGVWMNTQRPEWNDANNALAGYGLSVVTTGYLYRYVVFLEGLLSDFDAESIKISKPLTDLIESLGAILADDRWQKGDSLEGADRFALVAKAGKALEVHRRQVYQSEFGVLEEVGKGAILDFLKGARQALKKTLRSNLREDGMYHAYNTLEIDAAEETMGISYLPMMLEGQVSILSSGILEAKEAADLLEVMASSALVSERHQTYLLYPDQQPKGFLESNKVAKESVQGVETLTKMLEQGDTRIIEADSTGADQDYRFHWSLTNGYELSKELDELEADPTTAGLMKNDRAKIEALYEETFNHQSFTGRSGSMFGYEGLGCVYWHMVSKLMLAVQEVALQAMLDNESTGVQQRLISAYFSVQSGLGFRKTAKDYGGFPAEAYSHSPAHAGCQQPGLTGQVKEGVLCRFGELGVEFSGGQLSFHPRMLRDAEFSEEALEDLGLAANTMSFTIARTPVVYHRSKDLTDASATVYFSDGSTESVADACLSPVLTSEITGQSGRIERIEVKIPASWLIAS